MDEKDNCRIYIAASFKHLHGVRFLAKELERLGCEILDWTAKASPPPGLTPQERRIWMDTDQNGGQVYNFCKNACMEADLVIYYGASGQDAGVEIGMAAASGVPILGIRGPLEGPGLMLHGAVTAWVENGDEALRIIELLLGLRSANWAEIENEPDKITKTIGIQMKNHSARKLVGISEAHESSGTYLQE